ncbi:hypothetical protein AA15669_0668 [Saccharibacter floricola DSM 15669]|uniref:Uncharacterized protein n=1 Tax=Saccharibacter floricola DSM 15669 TaxID=1123227 RepID=A0ABQ0NY05_9PROT|nr:hypothetical protein AA15669_0668 [Saccharibacter floricola DSM 15669]
MVHDVDLKAPNINGLYPVLVKFLDGFDGFLKGVILIANAASIDTPRPSEEAPVSLGAACFNTADSGEKPIRKLQGTLDLSGCGHAGR